MYHTYRIALTSLTLLLCTVCPAKGQVVLEAWRFGPRTEVPKVNDDPLFNNSPALSADGLTLLLTNYVERNNQDIVITTRDTMDDPWAAPESLSGEVNSQYLEEGPFLSADGLSLYFTDGIWDPPADLVHRPGSGGGDIWVSRRKSLEDDFGTPERLSDTVNSESYDGWPKLSSDELTLVFDSTRSNGLGRSDLWITHRADHESPWQVPENLGPIINSKYHDVTPALSSDGLTLFFASDRPGGIGGYDIWVASRDTIDGNWAEPVPLDENINTRYNEGVPSPSPDGSTLYFGANNQDYFLGPVWNIFQAARWIAGDFDGDGVLTAADIDLLMPGSPDLQFDLDDNGLVDLEDRRVWVKELKNTWIGDADLFGEFNTGDLVAVFQAGEYDDNLPMNSSWSTGDWNGDKEFDTGDLVLAFQDGGFEQGPVGAIRVVPEPTAFFALIMAGLIGIAIRRQTILKRDSA